MDKEQQKEIKRCERLRLKAQESNNLKEESEWCNALGNLYLQAGDHDEALNMHKQELALCRSLQDIVGEAVANRKIGDVYLAMENYDLAISHHKKHLDLAESDIVELQRANTSLGQTYLEQARSLTSPRRIIKALKKSIGLLTQSVDLTSELKEEEKVSSKELHEMKIRSYINLGLCHHQLSLAADGDDKAAASKNCCEFFQKAIFLAEKCNANEELYLANRIMCDINVEQKQISASLRNAESALKIAKASGNKQKLFESLNLCAQVHMYLDNMEAAKTCLKKSYRMKGHAGSDLVEDKLKTVLRMIKTKADITNEDLEVDHLFKLHEAIADMFCKLECYVLAVKHYTKQEELLHEMSYCTTRHRATVFFSIATTLIDVGEYPEAIEYFKKELESNEDNTERAKTFTHVANCYERMRDSYEIVRGYYDKALKCATDSGNGRLQLQTLTALEKSQQNYEKRIEASETGTKIAALEAKWGLFADDVDEDSQDTCQNSCPLDDSEELLRVEMEKVSDDDSDGDDVTRKRRKPNFSKKNEKGETPLHRACIEGHVMRVKLLLEQGHPVNPRDFCDWTPLHEASNHGYEEIVKLLLSNGASVNAIGGQQQDAITPIQDAASNGHFAIVSMLLGKGADPNIPDFRGRTALDTLIAHYHTHKDEMDPGKKHEYKQLHAILKQRQNDRSSTSRPTSNHSDLLGAELLKLADEDGFSEPTTSQRVIEEEEEEEEEDQHLPDLTQREFRRKRSGVLDYKESIAALGSSTKLPVTQTQSRNAKRAGPSSSLMRENEQDGDDWLVEDDVDDDAPFRQPMKKPRRLEVTKWERPSTAAKRGWKKITPKITEFYTKSPTNIEVAFDPVDLTNGDDVVQPSQRPSPTPSPVVSTPAVAPVSSSLRVKVKVKDTIFLVGIPGRNKPVSWLEERASTLYANMAKIRPKLTLFTCDGARLLSDDQICDVISNNDVIEAKEDTWNVAPFAQRYAEMCKNSGIMVVPKISSACRECESSTILEIKDFAFGFACLNPMLATLRQPEVTRILLPGNRLSDDGVQCMCGSLLRTVTSQSSDATLIELNLACNNISGVGLRKMLKCPVFSDLTRLDLSYNPLRGGENLVQLLESIKNLKFLSLSNCYLTEDMFKTAETQQILQKALCNIRELDISGNRFGSKCVFKWLESLKREKVDVLNLSGVTDEKNNHNLTFYLDKFLRKHDRVVTSVDISCNDLQEKHIATLRPSLHLVGALYISE